MMNDTMGMGDTTHSNHTTAGASSTHDGMSAFLFSRSSGFFVLFQEAHIHSIGAFIGALVASFLFAAFASALSLPIAAKEKAALASGSVIAKVMAAILFAVRNLLHYTAMLLVMTMNIWIIVAVVVGHALGFLVYGLVVSRGAIGHAAAKAEDGEQL